MMDLDKYIRPDGSTYYAYAAADPNDKLFVEQLPGVDVTPKKTNWAVVLLALAAAYAYS